MVNFTEPGTIACVISAGKFGERWGKICDTYQCDTRILSAAYGQFPTPADVTQFIDENKPQIVFFQANETSTAVAPNLDTYISAIRKNHAPLIAVDGISAVVAHDINMIDSGIDILVGGCQKGFGVDPGLAFIAYSDQAADNFSTRPRFYFDLRKEAKSQASGKAAYTPPIQLIVDMNRALTYFESIGFNTVSEHHHRRAVATRAAIAAIGLETLNADHFSNTVTAVNIPHSVDGKALLKKLASEYGYIFAGGQDELSGKIIRISHLGFVNEFDMLGALGALEMGLKEAGHTFTLGSGVSAFTQMWMT